MINRFKFLGVLFLVSFSLSAQQLTRFAVVDVQKIILSFYKDSKAMRDFEEKKAKIQIEIDKMTSEVKELQKQKIEAETRGDKVSSLGFDKEISTKTEFIKQYYAVKKTELEENRKTMLESNQFVQQIYREIQTVAETDGYTLVLDVNATNAIIWYSPAVDLTEKVIQNLKGKILP